ncbi:MAG: glutamine--scyllo-inositol aminotransferase, partial [Chloroflexi bacterium]|nr:glutamine--scyllo-inositol aminotransferase [Chloroflexota bacterium]
MEDRDRLAIDGGAPLISEPIPSGVSGPSVVGEEEIAAVTEVLRSQKLFRYTEDSNAEKFEKESAEFGGT